MGSKTRLEMIMREAEKMRAAKREGSAKPQKLPPGEKNCPGCGMPAGPGKPHLTGCVQVERARDARQQRKRTRPTPLVKIAAVPSESHEGAARELAAAESIRAALSDLESLPALRLLVGLAFQQLEAMCDPEAEQGTRTAKGRTSDRSGNRTRDRES